MGQKYLWHDDKACIPLNTVQLYSISPGLTTAGVPLGVTIRVPYTRAHEEPTFHCKMCGVFLPPMFKKSHQKARDHLLRQVRLRIERAGVSLKLLEDVHQDFRERAKRGEIVGMTDQVYLNIFFRETLRKARAEGRLLGKQVMTEVRAWAW